MKKLFLLVSAVFAIIVCYAQLKEVRGIQTSAVKYYDEDYKMNVGGFEFVNENDYSVWVDAELCTQGFTYNDDTYTYTYVIRGTRATKSFSLKPKETYVWKCGDKMIFKEYSGDYGDYSEKFYVQYKAYKAE